MVGQFQRLIKIAEPHEQQGIREIGFTWQLRLVLLLEQRRLEKKVDGQFDPVTSRKLDAIKVLLGE